MYYRCIIRGYYGIDGRGDFATEVWQTSNLRRLRLGEEKKERKKEEGKNKPQHENIYGLPIP